MIGVIAGVYAGVSLLLIGVTACAVLKGIWNRLDRMIAETERLRKAVERQTETVEEAYDRGH